MNAHRQDIDFLRRVFPQLNRSFTSATRALFDARLQDLDRRADSLGHGAFVMGICHAVAAAGDGHTNALPFRHLSRAPIRLHAFSDGVHVVRAAPGAKALLGARVASIGGHAPEAVLTRLEDYVGGTPEHVRVVGTVLLESPAALAGAGLLEDDGTLPVRVRMGDGSLAEHALEALAPQPPAIGWYRRARLEVAAVPSPSTEWAHVLDGAGDVPLYLQATERTAFHASILGGRVLYVRISASVDLPDVGLDQYLDDVLAGVQPEPPRHAVVDLRFNGGGDYLLVREFATRLPRALRPGGRVFVVTGNHTFSAGLATAALLKYHAAGRAVIVGERVGDRERFWAEGGVVELPNSRLPVRLTDGLHDWRDGCHDTVHCPWFNRLHGVAAGPLSPDLPVQCSFSDYLQRRDPVMAAIEAAVDTGASPA